MSKIMQIARKNTSFERGVVDLDLVETSFKGLAKTLASAPSQKLENIATGEVLGFEVFKDINLKQYALKQRCDIFLNRYNTFIDYARRKGVSVSRRGFTFRDLTSNYYAKIKKGDPIDLNLMRKVVTPELELRGFREEMNSSMLSTQAKLKEWSKSKNYSDVVRSATSRPVKAISEFAELFVGDVVGINSSDVVVERIRGGEENWRVTVKNIENITAGTEVSFNVYGKGYRGYVNFRLQVTRIKGSASVGKVSGNFITKRVSSNYEWYDGFYGRELRSYKGNHSSYFDNPNPDLSWLKSLELL